LFAERPTDFDHVSVTEEGIVVDAVMSHPVNVQMPPQQICSPMARKRRKEDPHGHVDMSTNLDNSFILDDPMLSLPALIQDRIPLPDTMCCRKGNVLRGIPSL